MPDAKIRRFEIVTVINGRMGEDWRGRRGVAIWCDRPWWKHRTGVWSEWGYCLYSPDMDSYRSFKESDLQPTGELDPEERHRGRRHEISFDCVLDDDMDNVEGSYRVPGRHWEVFGFGKGDVPEIQHSLERWQSGMMVLGFGIPKAMVIDRAFILRAMAEVFGADDWVEVRGPNSMTLR